MFKAEVKPSRSKEKSMQKLLDYEDEEPENVCEAVAGV